MKSENFLLAVAVISIVIVTLSLGVTYYSINSFKHNFLTGFATTSNGTILINITSAVSINFTTSSINWGAGRVTEGSTQAVLDTGNSANPVINGTDWTSVTQGFILENIGSLNASIKLFTSKNATTFIGGTSPSYQYNISNNKSGSCPAGNQAVTFGNYNDVNITNPGTTVCSRLQFLDSTDTLRIDIKLVVPYDAPTGNSSDQMQATASVAS